MTLLEIKNKLFELNPDQKNNWTQDVYFEFVHCGFKQNGGTDKGFFWSNLDLENIDQTLLEDQDPRTQADVLNHLKITTL
jgi:hypothetical protein